MRRDARPGPPLVDLLARLSQLRVFERPKAAVNGALMIEGQPTAEVVLVDEGDG